MATKIGSFETFKGQPVNLLARILDIDKTWLLPAKVDALSITVTQQHAGEVYTADLTSVLSTSLFTEAQGTPASPDPLWDFDLIDGPDPELGYNFKHLVPGAAFPNPQHTRVVYAFTRNTPAAPGDDEILYLVFDGAVISR